MSLWAGQGDAWEMVRLGWVRLGQVRQRQNSNFVQIKSKKQAWAEQGQAQVQLEVIQSGGTEFSVIH